MSAICYLTLWKQSLHLNDGITHMDGKMVVTVTDVLLILPLSWRRMRGNNTIWLTEIALSFAVK